MADITKQLSQLSGGSDAATNAQRKELLAELKSLQEEEADARKEAAREALLNNIDDQIEGLNTQLDQVNDSLNSILYALTQGEFKIATDSDGNVTLWKKDGENWIEHKFNNGGMVDFTGPAWVDGTPNNPEAFLSAADTRNMRNLLDAIQLISSGHMMTSSSVRDINENTSDINIENINIATNELNNQQDFRDSGRIFADEFAKVMRQRGLNINVKK
jgi:hypothetical protein